MLNKALMYLRVYNQMTQEELAAAIGMAKSSIGRIEYGSKKPCLKFVEKYSKFFKMPVSSIFLFSEVLAGDLECSAKSRLKAADKIMLLMEFAAKRE